MADEACDLVALEIETGSDPRLGVIWLHGLGADGHDFEPIVEQLKLPFAARFIFPHAPERAVTINGGLRMRAWYDILTINFAGPEDEIGIRTSAKQVHALIDRELERGLSAEQLVLAGFSQGGAIALHTALREPHALAGVVALSCYLPLATTLSAERSAANQRIPIFMAHGTFDPTVALSLAMRSKDKLVDEGYAVDWRSYEMGHSVCMEQITEMGAWLSRRKSDRAS